MVLLISTFLVFRRYGTHEKEPIQVALPTTVPTTEPTLVHPPREQTPLLLFPQNNATIVESNPSFMLKIKQTPHEIVLPTKLGEDTYWAPYGYYTEKFQGLEFISGEARNIGITIDGIPIPIIHGFAQYPYIVCTPEIDSEDFERRYSETECLELNAINLPPAIILFKSANPLSEGAHRIVVRAFERMSEFSVTVDSYLTIPRQDLPPQFIDDYFSEHTSALDITLAQPAYAGHDNSDRNDIDSSLQELQQPDYDWQYIKSDDACPADYWYTGDMLALPQPAYVNPFIYYSLHLPAVWEEFGAKNETEVSMMFDSYFYDLNITDYDSFYYSSEYDESPDRVYGGRSLFLPITHLVYTHSREPLLTRARAVTLDPQTKPSILFSYLEFTPKDYSGWKYKENTLLHTVIHSSGCDG